MIKSHDIIDDEPDFCPYCKSQQICKSGFRATVTKGRRQRYICQVCGRTFY